MKRHGRLTDRTDTARDVAAEDNAEPGALGHANIRRVAMPEPGECDYDIGDGARMKLPVRYD